MKNSKKKKLIVIILININKIICEKYYINKLLEMELITINNGVHVILNITINK